MREVQHQPRAHRVLQRALTHGRLPHAYLFAGPDGVGKETMALGLAQTLLCTGAEEQGGLLMPAEDRTPVAQSPLSRDACGECQDCRLVKAGTHPDLLLIYRQLNRQHPDSSVRKQKALLLVVDVIRHFLIERAGTYPSRGRARIFIVREAERMNDAAQNSLLKTLEEPPRSTFLILLSSALDKMLPTVRSRCQQVMFDTLPPQFVLDRLREFRPNTPAEQITYAALRSGGSLGAALRQIDDGIFELKKSWGERLIDVARNVRGFAPHALAKPFEGDAKALAMLVADRDPDVSDTDATRAGLQVMLGALGDFYSDALRQVTGAVLPAVNADQPEVIAALAAQSPSALAAALRAISDADYHLGRNASIELTLETMFISLANAHKQTVLV